MGQQFDTTSALVGDDLCQHRIATIHTMQTRQPASWVRLPGTHHIHIPAGPLADVLPATFDTTSSTWHLTTNCPDLHTPATSSSPTPNPAERGPAEDCTRCLHQTATADTRAGRWLRLYIGAYQLTQMSNSTWAHIDNHLLHTMRHNPSRLTAAAAELRAAHWILDQTKQLQVQADPDMRGPLTEWLQPLTDAARQSINLLQDIVADTTFVHAGNDNFRVQKRSLLRTTRQWWRNMRRDSRRPDVRLVLLDRHPQPADVTAERHTHLAAINSTIRQAPIRTDLFTRFLRGHDNYFTIAGLIVAHAELERQSFAAHTTDDLQTTALLLPSELISADHIRPITSLLLTDTQLAGLLDDTSQLEQPDSWTFDQTTVDTICKTFDRSYQPDNRPSTAEKLSGHLTAVATALQPT